MLASGESRSLVSNDVCTCEVQEADRQKCANQSNKNAWQCGVISDNNTTCGQGAEQVHRSCCWFDSDMFFVNRGSGSDDNIEHVLTQNLVVLKPPQLTGFCFCVQLLTTR